VLSPLNRANDSGASFLLVTSFWASRRCSASATSRSSQVSACDFKRSWITFWAAAVRVLAERSTKGLLISFASYVTLLSAASDWFSTGLSSVSRRALWLHPPSGPSGKVGNELASFRGGKCRGASTNSASALPSLRSNLPGEGKLCGAITLWLECLILLLSGSFVGSM